jgi:hypothetical protein
MVNCITYNTGYKYQLKETYEVVIDIRPAAAIETEFINLSVEGRLEIKKAYAWDGPSGPTFDTLDFMRGSLVHDALYQLMREELLDRKIHRDAADRLLQRICIEDGMSKFRAAIVYQSVSRFGDPSADPAKKRPPVQAPKGCGMVFDPA